MSIKNTKFALLLVLSILVNFTLSFKCEYHNGDVSARQLFKRDNFIMSKKSKTFVNNAFKYRLIDSLKSHHLSMRNSR
jgi:hypothetical protein